MNQDLSINANCQACAVVSFCSLCQIRTIRRSLAFDAAKTSLKSYPLTHWLLHLSPRRSFTYSLNRMQLILNVAAYLVYVLYKFDLVTLILRDRLHFANTATHDYKLRLLTFKGLHAEAPPYITERCKLSSRAAGQLIVPRTQTEIGKKGCKNLSNVSNLRAILNENNVDRAYGKFHNHFHVCILKFCLWKIMKLNFSTTDTHNG